MGADLFMELKRSDPASVVLVICGREYRAVNERWKDGPPGRGGRYVLKEDDEKRLIEDLKRGVIDEVLEGV